MHRTALFALVLILFVLLAIPGSANACSCGPKPTVLESYEQAKLVIIAKVISIERVKPARPEDDDDYEAQEKPETEKEGTAANDGEGQEDEELPFDPETNPYLGVRSTTVVIEKVFKGVFKTGQKLVLGQGSGSDCVSSFTEESIGDQLLLYLGNSTRSAYGDNEPKRGIAPPPLRYYHSYCDRYGDPEYMYEDLAYLENMKKVRGKTRVSGRVYRRDNGPSVANLRIKIIGATKTYETKTDKNGFYEVYDLPAGDYFIEPQVQKGWKVSDSDYDLSRYLEFNYGRYRLKTKNQIPFKLTDKRHASVHFTFTDDISIRGRVLSPEGRPMAGVGISAVKSLEYRLYSDTRTNERGEYEILPSSPGSYFIVVNPGGARDGQNPFGQILYPGVSDVKQAGTVSVDTGTHLKDIDIQVTATLGVFDVTGQVLYADDKPVVDKWVDFISEDSNVFGNAREKTDKNGNFMIRLPQGARGKIVSEIYGYGYKESCPEMAKIMEITGKSSLYSNEIAITVEGTTPTIILKMPFVFCEESKK